MSPSKIWLAGSLAGIALAAACGGGTNSPAQPCGMPPPSAYPPMWLVYPAPNATSVPANLAQLIFADGPGSGQTVAVTSPGGPAIQTGTPTSAPSPLPTPNATPGGGGYVFYLAVPIASVEPSTTYTVLLSEQVWSDNPPSCQSTQTQSLGSFTTQ